MRVILFSTQEYEDYYPDLDAASLRVIADELDRRNKELFADAV